MLAHSLRSLFHTGPESAIGFRYGQLAAPPGRLPSIAGALLHPEFGLTDAG